MTYATWSGYSYNGNGSSHTVEGEKGSFPAHEAGCLRSSNLLLKVLSVCIKSLVFRPYRKIKKAGSDVSEEWHQSATIAEAATG